MKLSQLLDRRAGFGLASLGLLLSMAAPAVIPAFASAATLSQRSITMSTSAINATGVSYNLKFTGTAAISVGGGLIIDFCSNSSVLEDGNDCTTPADMDTTSAGVTGVAYDGTPASGNGSVTSASDGHVVWTAAAAYSGAGDSFEMTLTGIGNPSAIGVFYARVSTYADGTALSSYTDATDVGNYSDDGSIALAATGGIGVTSYVLEAMSFCVSYGGAHGDTQAAPSENCGSGEADCNPTGGVDDGCVVAPSMTLGEETAPSSGIYALESGSLSTGQVYAQLSSNATGNTVVNLKSDATDCGGLYLNGVKDAAHCHISPATADFTAGDANFGLKVGSAAAAPTIAGGAGSGSGTIAASGSYNASTYFMDYVDGDATGVTSTYGSPLFSTTGAVDNMNIPVTFGASISNNTPAGTYGATLSMIAVGTF